jgi:hypothetical protein
MNAKNFVARLKRDLAKNKAKSAVLGMLCLVAVYYWVPLLGKLIWKPSPKTDVAATLVEDASPSTPVSVAESKLDRPPFGWQDFATWCKSDPRMTPISLAPDVRNPFALHLPELAADNDLEDAGSDAVAELRSPAELGLKLQGTMIGAGTSTANISGEVYHLGARVPEIRSPGHVDERDRFRLVEVGSRHVLLQRDGTLHRLEMDDQSATSEGTILIRSWRAANN